MADARLQRCRELTPELTDHPGLARLRAKNRELERLYVNAQAAQPMIGCTITVPLASPWRPPHDNAAEQIARAHSHRFVYNIADDALHCACGERVKSNEIAREARR